MCTIEINILVQILWVRAYSQTNGISRNLEPINLRFCGWTGAYANRGSTVDTSVARFGTIAVVFLVFISSTNTFYKDYVVLKQL